MKLFRRLVCVSLFLLIGSILLANAQPSGVPLALRASNDGNLPVGSEAFTVYRQVQEAQVRFTATDRTGRPVLGLRPEDVQVFDDQVRVPELKSLMLSQYQPLEVGVLVDLSDSISPEQKDALVAADLLEEIFDANRDEAFVVGFSNRIRMLQPETTDISLVREALLRNKGRQGLTSLFDAIVQTCRAQFAGHDFGGRQRILLLFSDGADTLSMHGVDEAVSEALRAGAAIYAITASDDDLDGFRNLERLTEQTGGRVYSIPKKRRLDALKVAMSQSVRGEYTISFHPATTSAGFHPVRIEVPALRDVTLRSPTGYYIGTN